MTVTVNANLVMETDPKFTDVRSLEQLIYEASVQASGISDGKLFSVFLRDTNAKMVGGIFGWTWGDTCPIRSLFVPPNLRRQGHGSNLMRIAEGGG